MPVFDPPASATTGAPQPGGLAVFLGDSTTSGADDNINMSQGISWPNYASIISGQRLTYVRNAGKPSDTTAQMLARFDTDVTPYLPNVVPILCGTNDASVTLFDAWATSLRAIVAKVLALGAVPVLCTLPPNNTASAKRNLTRFNSYLRSYAASQRLPLVDFYTVLADPTNSDFKSAYFSDGVHPNAAGYKAMGQAMSDALSSVLPPGGPPLCSDDIDPSSLLYKGCFGGYAGSGLPTGWVDAAGIPAGSVLSYVTDAAVPGQMVTITQTATAGLRQLSYAQYIGATTLSNSPIAGGTSAVIPIRADYAGVLFIGAGATLEAAKIASSAGGGPQTETLVRGLAFGHSAGEAVIANAQPGDVLIYTGIVTSDGGVTWSASTTMTGTAYSPIAANALSGAVTRGRFYQRFVVPAGCTKIDYRLTVGAGTGVVSFGQVGVYNATQLGI